MHTIIMRLILLGSTGAAIMLSGCGSSSDVTSAAPSTVSGVAATGQPIAGQVFLKDSAASPKELSAATGKDGSYVINVTGLTAPYMVKVQWTDGNGSQSLVSFATAPGTANINPLSHMIVANAAGLTDTESLYNSDADMKVRIGQALKSSVTLVSTQLKPLLDAYGVTVDPLSGPFVANHTGLDALLDAVKIVAAGGSVTVTNRSSGATIFGGTIANLVNGVFIAANLPVVSPVQTQPSIDGAALYAAHCAGCHGSLASSTKKGSTLARLESAINAQIGGMGSLSALSATERQAIVDALVVVTTTPATPPSTTPTPVPTPTPTPVDGASLYASNCAGCHSPLASSGKAGTTATRIQTAIAGNAGGMGYLSSLSTTQVQAIATVLAAVTPAPAPTPVCGSCHGLPPGTGSHSKHRSRSCATCHGTGFSTTTVNAATHNNGVKNLLTSIGWSTSSRSCTNSCHGRENW